MGLARTHLTKVVTTLRQKAKSFCDFLVCDLNQNTNEFDGSSLSLQEGGGVRVFGVNGAA